MIELSEVGKQYGTRTIIHNVSLTVRDGEAALLVGANGTGKSTVLKIMAGLVRADKGTVIRGCKDALTAYLGHSTFLYNGMTALENLIFWEGIYGGDTSKKRLIAMLDHVGLKPFVHERAGIFSRGMAQRLNLARVLLREPRLLLLDEPATGLDSSSVELLRNEVLHAKKRGAAVVWITHTPHDDAHIADTVFELADKTVAFNGSPEKWIQNRRVKDLPLC